MLLLCLFFVFSVGEGMGEGDLVVMLGALSVAREGRVPRVARVAVEAVRRVDALSQEAVDVAAGAPGDRNAFAISLEAGVKARGDRHRALRVRAPRSSCEALALKLLASVLQASPLPALDTV